MSGIFGLFRKDGALVEPATLETMREAMAFWGPERSGAWHAGPVGLGHLLMKDTPESRLERQPSPHPQIDSLVITADARIDNRDELFDALRIPHPERAAMPDNLLILHAYARWGKACVARLLGAFAFAIWDGRENLLFCARDHIGFRPFYYYDGPRRFLFATDIKAILAVEGVPRRLDEEALTAHYVRHYNLLKERTFFHDIARLPPAHLLTASATGTRRERHWIPGGQEEIRLPSNDAYAELLRERLRQAVDCRLRSVHPIGSHLSGGLDSSGVSVLAAHRLRDSGRALARAYSWSPPPAPEDYPLRDERALVERVCQEIGVGCSYTTLSPADVAAFYRRDVSVEPVETLLHELAVLKVAEGQGTRVILSGWGGDELITNRGRGYFAGLLLRGHWRTLWCEGRERARLNGRRAWIGTAIQALEPLVPDGAYRMARRDLPLWARRVLAETPATWADFGPLARRLLHDIWPYRRVRPGVHRNQLIMLELGHLTYRLEAWAQAGALHGITHRYPLLDRRLIELSLALPVGMYVQQGWDRFLFRYTMSAILPPDVCWNRSMQEPAKWNAQQHLLEAGLREFLEDPGDDTSTAGPLVRQHTIHFKRLNRHILAVTRPISLT